MAWLNCFRNSRAVASFQIEIQNTPNHTTMEQIQELTEVQRKIECIIHNTTEEMREKQPGVMQWRMDVLRKISEYRMELVAKLREVAL